MSKQNHRHLVCQDRQPRLPQWPALLDPELQQLVRELLRPAVLGSRCTFLVSRSRTGKSSRARRWDEYGDPTLIRIVSLAALVHSWCHDFERLCSIRGEVISAGLLVVSILRAVGGHARSADRCHPRSRSHPRAGSQGLLAVHGHRARLPSFKAPLASTSIPRQCRPPGLAAFCDLTFRGTSCHPPVTHSIGRGPRSLGWPYSDARAGWDGVVRSRTRGPLPRATGWVRVRRHRDRRWVCGCRRR